MNYKINTEIKNLIADLSMITFITAALLICSTYALGAIKNTITENSLYHEECGSCHMVYPANFLPDDPWDAIMTNLESHFGDDASLDLETLSELTQYLINNSATTSKNRRSRKIFRSLGSNKSAINPVTRISEVPYIKNEHDEVKDFLASRNSDIKNLTQCDSCHADAEKGLFDEDTVDIPNIGAWED